MNITGMYPDIPVCVACVCVACVCTLCVCIACVCVIEICHGSCLLIAELEMLCIKAPTVQILCSRAQAADVPVYQFSMG